MRIVRSVTVAAAFVAAVVLCAGLALPGCGLTFPGSDGSGGGGGGGGGPTPTPGRTPTPNPSATPTPSPTASPTGSPTGSPTPTPSGSPTPTPAPTILPSFCGNDNDCQNGQFCDGEERCINTSCTAGTPPCDDFFEECDEETDTCVPANDDCLTDADCEANEFCNFNSGNCQPDFVQNCGPGRGACNINNSSPGCEQVDCCEDVCVVDISCCLVQWDDECANLALTISDCLAN